jgi:hypothetical protein
VQWCYAAGQNAAWNHAASTLRCHALKVLVMRPDKMPHSMKFHINDKMPHCSNGAYNAAIMSGGITPNKSIEILSDFFTITYFSS